MATTCRLDSGAGLDGRGLALIDALRLRARHLDGDLQTRRIDDAENRIALAAGHRLARSVPALDHHAGESGTNHCAALLRLGRVKAHTDLRDRRFGREARRPRGFQFVSRCQALRDERFDPLLVFLRGVEFCGGFSQLELPRRHLIRNRRDVEPHQQVAGLYQVALVLRQLRDLGGLVGGDDEIRNGRGDNGAGDRDRVAERPRARGLNGDGDGFAGDGLLAAPAAASERAGHDAGEHGEAKPM
jgi:hypothetical protein